MNLNLENKALKSIISGNSSGDLEGYTNIIYYDTRLIHNPQSATFFAIRNRRDGHDFLQKAYQKGIRTFVVEKEVQLPEGAQIITVPNTLRALQKVAKHHRDQFSYPVIGITGSLGKTTIKEWLYFLLSDDYKVVRSPKSFNSQIGVAISLMELSDEHDLALIEADISHPQEMDFIEEMISPTIGIYTGIGKYYAENFSSQEEHAAEHLKLFKYANVTFAREEIKSELRRNKINAEIIREGMWDDINFSSLSYPNNRKIALHVAQYLGVSRDVLLKKVFQLPVLSNRMEVFEGQDNNLIINDSYNIDIDALEQALSYQFSSNERENKVVVLDFSFVDPTRKNAILEVVKSFSPHQVFIIEDNQLPPELLEIKNSSILFKGSYRSNLKDIVLLFKNRKHETWIEFDLKAIENNIQKFREKIPAPTRLLAMVKASSYGTGDTNIPHFLQQIGVEYLGVAYTDEGTTLRENGITLPILVLNTEGDAFEDLIRFHMEPSIFSFEQLNQLISRLERDGITHFPIQITVETGMNRLGFQTDEITDLIKILKVSSTIKLNGVYSHLADADNVEETYTLQQIERFKEIRSKFIEAFPDQQILFHILNSEGASKFGKIAGFDMIRLGIGLYGYTSTWEKEELLPALRWKTTISQIKEVKSGETVGYGRKYLAEKPVKIATIRVGYADGFRRSLSNGVGEVYINDQPCKVVGNVCMDMTMVDVSHIDCEAGDEVEIIGNHIDMQTFSDRLQTIPYEVMTSISKRVSRIYLK